MSLESNAGALTYAAAFIGALIIGKSVLIVDALPVWDHFDNKSRIALIIGRTIAYAFVALVFQFLEEIIPLVGSEGSLGAGFDKLIEEIHWGRFWGTHIQLLTFLALYNTLAVIAEEMGRDRFRRLLFGNSGAAG